MRRFSLILGFVAVLPACLYAAAPLSTVRQIRQLSPAEAQKGVPVRIEGVVTYNEPAERILFLQDRTGPIFIKTKRAFPFVAGDRIQVLGTTSGSYRIVVSSNVMRRVGKAPLPSPTPATFPELMAGQWDCAYVTVSGKVLSATIQHSAGPPFLLLELLMDGGTVDVHIEDPGKLNPRSLLDSQVVATGISGGRFDGKFQLVGANIYLSSPANLRITSPAPEDPSTLPSTPIDRIMGSYNVVERSRRVRVRGAVTLYEPGSQLAVERAGKAVLIRTHQISPLNIGDVVYATGFADADGYTESLEHGQFLRTGRTAPVRPQPVTWKDALTGQYAFNLISMEGRLIEQVHEPGQDTLFVDSDGHVFSAVLRHPGNTALHLPSFRPGSSIRVSGVCFVEKGGPWGSAVGFELHLRDAQDVRVLALSAWWTVPHLVYITITLALLIFAAIAWVFMLRRRVSRQTHLLRRGVQEEAIRERRQIHLEKERSRVLEAINSRQPLDQVLAMITDLISEQMDDLQCWCEVAATGASTAPLPELQPASSGKRAPRTFRRDILSSAGERLGTLVMVWTTGKKPMSLRSELLDMGVSLAALAIDNRRLYEGLVRRSEYDQLTDIPNRFLLESCLKEVLANAERDEHRFALIYVDLNRFKAVNDRYGHHFGDIYLQNVVKRLSEKLRSQDMLARVGGDEFIVLIPKVHGRAEAEEIATRLETCFDSPFSIDGKSILGSASIGVAVYPDDGVDEDQLHRFADSAMYASKHQFSWLGAPERN